MYLPAFGRIAADFRTSTSAISLSLSTYFVGFALGQILYGPLLDRFGRKRPIYVGLGVYVMASLGCVHPASLKVLVVLRFLQAIGGCVAQVASVAMVRDFFPPDQSAKIFSLLFLIIGVSPLLAPTVGSLLMLWLGWQSIFLALAGFTICTLITIALLLPEVHGSDPGISLAPLHMLRSFWHILRQPQFYTYAFAGAFSFAGLFAYVAGSPIIFMDRFRVSETVFGAIFAVLTMGFIGGSQINIFLLRRLKSSPIFSAALRLQVIVGFVFLAGARFGWYGMTATLILFFLFLSCIGLTYPNAAAIALAPFSRNSGSASALLGFIQMGIGAIVSTGIGFFGVNAVVALLFGTALVALLVHSLGMSVIGHPVVIPEEEIVPLLH